MEQLVKAASLEVKSNTTQLLSTYHVVLSEIKGTENTSFFHLTCFGVILGDSDRRDGCLLLNKIELDLSRDMRFQVS